MNLVFTGWHGGHLRHEHQLTPCKDIGGAVINGESGDPLDWSTPMTAVAKIDGVSLSGSFCVQLSFQKEELRNWLLKYTRSEPEAALRLLAKMQAEAVIALARKMEKSVDARIEEYLDGSGSE